MRAGIGEARAVVLRGENVKRGQSDIWCHKLGNVSVEERRESRPPEAAYGLAEFGGQGSPLSIPAISTGGTVRTGEKKRPFVE